MAVPRDQASPPDSASPSGGASPSASASPPDSASPSGGARPPDSASPSGGASPSASATPPDSAGPSAGTSPPAIAGPPGGPNPAARASVVDPTGELRELASDCVHCGFCLPACPTYQLWAEEMDSPRGRIHLITQLLDGAQAGEAAAAHFDRCLGCMACVPACPSGVRYDRLIEAARSWSEEPPPGPPPVPLRSRRDRAVRTAIFQVFPYPRRLRALTAPLRAAQRAGLDRLIQRSGLAGRSPRARRRAPGSARPGPAVTGPPRARPAARFVPVARSA